MPPIKATQQKPSLISLLKPYSGIIFLLVVLTILPSGLNLVVPKIIANAIDHALQMLMSGKRTS